MKPLLLISAIFLTGSLFVNAQSFQLYYNNQPFPQGNHITVADVPTAQVMLGHMGIKNISSTPKLVKVKKHEIQIVPGTMNTFCWYVCWANTVYVSPIGLIIEPGVLNNEFSGDYYPLGNAGVSILRYTFFDDANPNDSVHFFIHFNAGTVGARTFSQTKTSFSSPYPNPASYQVTFDYQLSPDDRAATIQIHNLLGTIVKEIPISDRTGKVTIDVSDLSEGFYFYSIKVNNQVLETKRLVISR